MLCTKLITNKSVLTHDSKFWYLFCYSYYFVFRRVMGTSSLCKSFDLPLSPKALENEQEYFLRHHRMNTSHHLIPHHQASALTGLLLCLFKLFCHDVPLPESVLLFTTWIGTIITIINSTGTTIIIIKTTKITGREILILTPFDQRCSIQMLIR